MLMHFSYPRSNNLVKSSATPRLSMDANPCSQQLSMGRLAQRRGMVSVPQISAVGPKEKLEAKRVLVFRASSCHRSLCRKGSAGFSPSEWNKSMPMSQFHTSLAATSRALFAIAARRAAVRPWAARGMLALRLHCLGHSPPGPTRARKHALFDELPPRGGFTNPVRHVAKIAKAQHLSNQYSHGEKRCPPYPYPLQ